MDSIHPASDDPPPPSASRLWIARNNLIDADIVVDDCRREHTRTGAALREAVLARNRAAVDLARAALGEDEREDEPS